MEEIRCDVCHELCTPKGLLEDKAWFERNKLEPCEINECIELKGRWGYFSENPIRDLEEHEAIICQPCYEKIKNYIENELGGKIKVSKYDPMQDLLSELEEKKDAE